MASDFTLKLISKNSNSLSLDLYLSRNVLSRKLICILINFILNGHQLHPTKFQQETSLLRTFQNINLCTSSYSVIQTLHTPFNKTLIFTKSGNPSWPLKWGAVLWHQAPNTYGVSSKSGKLLLSPHVIQRSPQRGYWTSTHPPTSWVIDLLASVIGK